MAGKTAPSVLELQKDAIKTGGGVRNAGGGEICPYFYQHEVVQGYDLYGTQRLRSAGG